MRTISRTLSAVFIIAATAPWLALAAEPGSTNGAAPAKPAMTSTDLFGDPAIAKGKGFEIKRSQVDEEAIRQMAQAAGTTGQQISPDRKLALEQNILSGLIDLQLLQAKATEADRATGYTLADKQFEDMKAQLVTEENLNRQLKAWGATREEVLAKWRAVSVADAVLTRELKVTVTEDSIKSYYDEHRTEFEQPEMIRFSHILLSVRDPVTRTELSDAEKTAKHKLAEDLLKRARAGEDFAKLAKDNSEDTVSKDKGGEYIFSRDMIRDPDLKLAAFALSTNEVSEIVTTQLGYHILKLSEKFPSKMAGLNDEIAISPARFFVVKKSWTGATDSTWKIETPSSIIRRSLEGQQRAKLVPAFLAGLRKEAGVEILDETLKPKDNFAVPGMPAGAPPVTPGSKQAPK